MGRGPADPRGPPRPPRTMSSSARSTPQKAAPERRAYQRSGSGTLPSPSGASAEGARAGAGYGAGARAGVSFFFATAKLNGSTYWY